MSALELAGLVAALAVPLAAAGPKTVTSADGVRIHYGVGGSGEPALVFVHCWACDRSFWDAPAAHFSKRHRVVTLDLAGHGQSGRNRKAWTIAAFGDDVKAVVDALKLKRFVLIGHSMGGPVILEAARRMPLRVAGLVLVDTLVDVEQKMPPEQLEAWMRQLEADYKGTTTGYVNEYLFAPSTPAAVRDRVRGQALALPPEISIAAIRSAVSYDPLPALREIKAPIRAINGDKFPTNVAANRRHMPGYEAAIMKGVGHYPMLEEPAGFNRLLDETLRGLGLAGRR